MIDAIGSSHGEGKWKEMVLVDDRIADSIFQQIQTRPQEYSILATSTSMATTSPTPPQQWWEVWAWHPAPTSARTPPSLKPPMALPRNTRPDRINPGSVIRGVMMLEFLGQQEAADLVTKGLSAAIADKQVTYDLARLMEPQVDPVSYGSFAEARSALRPPLRPFTADLGDGLSPPTPRTSCRRLRPLRTAASLPTCASYRVLASEMDSPAAASMHCGR